MAKRLTTLSKGKKKTVTVDTVRANFAKGAPKRKAKKSRAQAAFAEKLSMKPKKPRA